MGLETNKENLISTHKEFEYFKLQISLYAEILRESTDGKDDQLIKIYKIKVRFVLKEDKIMSQGNKKDIDALGTKWSHDIIR